MFNLVLKKNLYLLIFIALFMGISSTFLMTASYDETWILFSVKNILGHGGSGAEFSSIVTTGGPYSFLQMIILYLFNNNLIISGLVSFISLILSLWFIFKVITLKKDFSLSYCLLFIPILSFPSTMQLAGLAHGAIFGFLLQLIGIYFWINTSLSSKKRIFLTSVFFAFSITTRVNYIFILPAFLLSFGFEKIFNRDVFRVVIGSISFSLFIMMVHLILQSDFLHGLKWLLYSTGIRNLIIGAYSGESSLLTFDIILTRIFNFEFLSTFLIAVFGAFWIFLKKKKYRENYQIALFFYLFSVINMLFWVFVAQNTALRYLWPSQASLACVLGDCIFNLILKEKNQVSYLKSNLMLLALLLWISFGCYRMSDWICFGETNFIGHQAKYMNIRLPKNYQEFKAVKIENERVDFIEKQTNQEEKGAISWSNYQLAFLAEREIYQPQFWESVNTFCSFYIKDSGFKLTQKQEDWLRKNSKTVKEKSGLVVYNFIEPVNSEDLLKALANINHVK